MNATVKWSIRILTSPLVGAAFLAYAVGLGIVWTIDQLWEAWGI